MKLAEMKSMKFATLLCLIPLQFAIGCHALPKFNTRNQAQTPNDNRVQLVTQCQTKCEQEVLQPKTPAPVKEPEIKSLGSYKWIPIDQSWIIRLPNWKNEVHFCPYRPTNGQWILTCKTNLDRIVDQLAGEHIGKAIVLDQSSLSSIPQWSDSLILCPGEEYIVTCEYYWNNALEVMKQLFFERIERERLGASASAFCQK